MLEIVLRMLQRARFFSIGRPTQAGQEDSELVLERARARKKQVTQVDVGVIVQDPILQTRASERQ